MNAPQPELRPIPAHVASVSDYEALARERMTPQAWAYVSGGAADEITLHENIAAFGRIRLKAKVLSEVSGGSTRLELFGDTFSSPIFLAPVAHQKLVHRDGELASVLGAGAQQTGMIVSTQASVALEEIARSAATPLWFQLYIQHDREFTAALVKRAEAAGYRALVVTVDAPAGGQRNREQRAGFSLPPGVEAVNLRGLRPLPASDGLLFGSPLLAAAPTWKDIAWLRLLTSLPLLLKGIMTPEDAARAVAEGADGIVVSNHGGRVLDTQPAAIDVLPEIAATVGGRVPVLLDGGIRRGSDVFKALALGAAAVLVGRPYIYALAAAGAVGVSHVLQILRAELELTMALTGCRELGAISAASLHRPERRACSLGSSICSVAAARP